MGDAARVQPLREGRAPQRSAANQLFACSAGTRKAHDGMTSDDLGSIWIFRQVAPHRGGGKKRLPAGFQLGLCRLLFTLLGLLQALLS